jgi:glycosyltransferase involved in cell wall biosynthesis
VSAVPKVSVNIAVKNRRALLAKCLGGLDAQTFRDFEVVVVDNGSTDGTAEDVAARATTFPLTVVTELGSLGAVRNAGVAASRGELVAFVDSDCVPTPDWLAKGLAAFDDDVAVVQGATLPDSDATLGRWFVTQEITEFTRRYEACNLFYRRAALLGAGGFDEAIGFFGEDSAAGWAVRRLGLGERFAPDAVVHHAVTHPGIRWHLRRGLRYGNWNALVRRFPEMRVLFWHRYFLRRNSAQTLFALYGVSSAAFFAVIGNPVLTVLGVAAATPFAVRHRPYTWRRREAIVDALGGAGFDIAVELGLLWGSIRERTLLL